MIWSGVEEVHWVGKRKKKKDGSHKKTQYKGTSTPESVHYIKVVPTYFKQSQHRKRFDLRKSRKPLIISHFHFSFCSHTCGDEMSQALSVALLSFLSPVFLTTSTSSSNCNHQLKNTEDNKINNVLKQNNVAYFDLTLVFPYFRRRFFELLADVTQFLKKFFKITCLKKNYQSNPYFNIKKRSEFKKLGLH